MPYWRLSGFYLFYYASLGALAPFWGKYLKAQGYDEAAIGALISVLMATKIIAPNVWGWFADQGLNRLRLVRHASLLSLLTFALVYTAHSFWTMALVMFVFSFFWNASLPQFEAITLNALGRGVDDYTRIRVWGSIGFIITSIGLGWVLDHYGTMPLPAALLLLMLGIWLSSLTVPFIHDGERPAEAPVNWRQKLAQPQVLALFAVCFLMQASHGPYYSLYTVYMNTYGYSDSLIGWLWALGVMTEVVVFLIMGRLIPRFGLRRIFLASMWLAAVRWCLIGLFAGFVGIQLFAQMLHAATFGTYHAVAIQLIHRLFTGPWQGRGQALYSSLSFGAGGALGALLSGWIWKYAAPEWMWGMAACASAAAFWVAKRFMFKTG